MKRTDNLPDLFEGALAAARNRREERACELMREVLRRTSSLPPDAAVDGSHELPAGFYFNSALAFLEIHHHCLVA